MVLRLLADKYFINHQSCSSIFLFLHLITSKDAADLIYLGIVTLGISVGCFAKRFNQLDTEESFVTLSWRIIRKSKKKLKWEEFTVQNNKNTEDNTLLFHMRTLYKFYFSYEIGVSHQNITDRQSIIAHVTCNQSLPPPVQQLWMVTPHSVHFSPMNLEWVSIIDTRLLLVNQRRRWSRWQRWREWGGSSTFSILKGGNHNQQLIKKKKKHCNMSGWTCDQSKTFILKEVWAIFFLPLFYFYYFFLQT